MLNGLGKAWGPPPFLSSSSPPKKFNIFNISPERSTFSQKKLLSAEMLNMLNSGGPVESKCASFCRNVEYVEYVECFGENLGPPPLSSSSPTYSTFPLKEAHFLKKMLLSAEMLNMLNSLARGHLLISPKTFNIFNIFNISAERSTF